MEIHRRARRRLVATAALLAIAACSPKPQPIAYGDAACEKCLMGIVDERWGSEIVTRTGKVHTFDSVECMVAYLVQDADREAVHSVWVTDFANPPALIPVSEAFFLRSDNLRSPMGLGLTAFGNESIRQRAVEDSFGGDLMVWEDVVAYVEAHWQDGGPHKRPVATRIVTDGPSRPDPAAHPTNGDDAAGASHANANN
jgi:copper chaperone NosL